jgi:hypothetical protein
MTVSRSGVGILWRGARPHRVPPAAASLAPAAIIVAVQQVVFPAPGGIVVRGVISGALTALGVARARRLPIPGYSAFTDGPVPSGPAGPGERNEPANETPHVARETGKAAIPVVPRAVTRSRLLDAEDLEVSYGNVPVLFGVDLDVRRGEAVALLGTNGAGKSTVLRAVSGLVPLTGGSITFDGTELRGHPPHRIAALGLIQMPGGQGIFPTLTVEPDAVAEDRFDDGSSTEEDVSRAGR